ncbi:heat shock 70 kDa protein 12A-like isoform X1 [Puntigrus tetrazona]|uniref:heat shock 70 kDa protein 12A-like isoform X1 n=2 Tax=Puntigrus tetrazona TaxID=1606681 RepID=UPI001C89256B|nr:heat shock 70 kDa protein 12A-like isoform X1 [Puntigrus tetrazona]
MAQFLYIAIDFGTSFSGYAFSFKTDKRLEQIRIPSWGMKQGLKTFKTPTCILFDEEQNFEKFGYDAMQTYTMLMKKEDAKKHYLFEHFKMELYNKEIHRDVMIKASNGKTMKALKVFSESLRFLKDHALDQIKINTEGRMFISSDVTWVLTVPAIWNAAAKQFMREAAVEAGLVTDSTPERLIFALEPEAASVFCKQLTSDGFIAEGEDCEDKLEQQPGSQYMVVDCGGGTIDITVHEVLHDGKLKELHAATGNDMGGQSVDKNVIYCFKDIFSEEIFEKFEKEHPSEALKLKYDIALIKSCDDVVMIPCPSSLQTLAKDKQSMESYFEDVQGVEWDDGGIFIEQEKLKSFFDISFSAIESTINQILKTTELRIEYMLLVGGYAQCPFLRKFMKKRFGSVCKILCPFEPQAVILKGAILYGKTPSVVKSRISALTYGFCICKLFDKIKHKDKSKYRNTEGKLFCDVCFDQLVSRGESVGCEEVRTFIRSPADPLQTEVKITFYSSGRQKVKFVDEWGVEEIGSLSVNMPIACIGTKRQVRLEIKFGSTEMQATATDLGSGETRTTKLDFMSEQIHGHNKICD